MSELTHKAAAPPAQDATTYCGRGYIQFTGPNVQTSAPVGFDEGHPRAAAQPVGRPPEVSVNLLEIPLSQIVLSRTNTRKSFDGPEMDELVTSVARKGVLQSVLVRPYVWSEHVQPPLNPSPKQMDARYELVCGERRYRAAERVGLKIIPAMVRMLSDDECREIQIIENLQRKDVSALEEAAGYKALLEARTKAQHNVKGEAHKTREALVAEIAAEIGKSPRYVWARMKLDQLIPEIKEALAAGRIDASHGDLVARFGEKQQKTIFAFSLFQWDGNENNGDVVSVRSLKATIQSDGADLKRAPWKLDDARVEPVCTGCEFNTDTCGGDVKAPYCLNRECYDTKLPKLVQLDLALLEKQTGKSAVRVGTTWTIKKGEIPKDKVKSAKLGSCSSVTPGLLVDGQGGAIGAHLVCADTKCKVHWVSTVATTPGAANGTPVRKLPAEDLERQKKEEREAVARRAEFLAVVGAVKALGITELSVIAEAICNPDDDLFKSSTDLCGLMGWEPATSRGGYMVKLAQQFTQTAAKLGAQKQAQALVGFALLCHDDYPGCIASLAKAYKLDVKAVRDKALTDLDAKDKVPAKAPLTAEQLNNLAPVKKAQPKQLSTSKQRIAAAFDKKLAKKPAAKKTAKKKAAKKGGK